MKKLLLFALLIAASVYSNAQSCVPDTQTVGGIYPDSATGLPPACMNELYNVIVTAVVPHDTSVTQAPFGTFTATIDSINIKKTNNVFQVNGLPPNFTFACEPPSCSFQGGATSGTSKSGCLLITGMPQAPVVAGDTFPLQVDLITYLSNVPVVGTYEYDDADVNYYYIAVRAQGACNTGISSLAQNNFSIKQNSPNPFNKNTTITFSNNRYGKVVFSVYNIIGEEVHSETLTSIEGPNNVILFYGNNLPSGVYYYSLNNGERTISSRMVLSEN